MQKSTLTHGVRRDLNGWVNIYTDGSKLRDGSTGAGICCRLYGSPVEERAVFLGTLPTVFQAEAMAIAEACQVAMEVIEREAKAPNKVVILTDSQAVLLALAKKKVTSKVIGSCKAA